MMNILSYFLAIFIEHSVRYLLYFLTDSFVILNLFFFFSSLHIIDITSLSDVWLEKILSYSVHFFFNSFIVSKASHRKFLVLWSPSCQFLNLIPWWVKCSVGSLSYSWIFFFIAVDNIISDNIIWSQFFSLPTLTICSSLPGITNSRPSCSFSLENKQLKIILEKCRKYTCKKMHL